MLPRPLSNPQGDSKSLTKLGKVMVLVSVLWYLYNLFSLPLGTIDRGKFMTIPMSIQSKLLEDDVKSTMGRPKIALLSSFIASSMWSGDAMKGFQRYINHTINKACYCHLWNIDFIFNQTRGITIVENEVADEDGSKWWLKFGCWDRVSHLQAAFDRGYEWVLYGDLDYIVKDMSRPIEGFLAELDLYGKDNVHVM